MADFDGKPDKGLIGWALPPATSAKKRHFFVREDRKYVSLCRKYGYVGGDPRELSVFPEPDDDCATCANTAMKRFSVDG